MKKYTQVGRHSGNADVPGAEGKVFFCGTSDQTDGVVEANEGGHFQQETG